MTHLQSRIVTLWFKFVVLTLLQSSNLVIYGFHPRSIFCRTEWASTYNRKITFSQLTEFRRHQSGFSARNECEGESSLVDRIQSKKDGRRGYFSITQRSAEKMFLKATPNDLDAESDTDKGQKVDMEKIELSLDSITDMIDTTFIKGCIDLASGYVDVLKLMIVSTKAAYSMKITLKELLVVLQEKTAVSSPAANRPLMSEEIELRSTWISVIYLTLQKISYESQQAKVKYLCDEIDLTLKKRYDDIIDKILSSGDGISISNVSIDQFLHLVDTIKDPVQRAISLQSIRVIILTLLVIEEENKCIPSTPRPPIPGAN